MAQDAIVCQKCAQTVGVPEGATKQDTQEMHYLESHPNTPTSSSVGSAKGQEFNEVFLPAMGSSGFGMNK